jgi:hypothetical protein
VSRALRRPTSRVAVNNHGRSAAISSDPDGDGKLTRDGGRVVMVKSEED